MVDPVGSGNMCIGFYAWAISRGQGYSLKRCRDLASDRPRRTPPDHDAAVPQWEGFEVRGPLQGHVLGCQIGKSGQWRNSMARRIVVQHVAPGGLAYQFLQARFPTAPVERDSRRWKSSVSALHPGSLGGMEEMHSTPPRVRIPYVGNRKRCDSRYA